MVRASVQFVCLFTCVAILNKLGCVHISFNNSRIYNDTFASILLSVCSLFGVAPTVCANFLLSSDFVI